MAEIETGARWVRRVGEEIVEVRDVSEEWVDYVVVRRNDSLPMPKMHGSFRRARWFDAFEMLRDG